MKTQAAEFVYDTVKRLGIEILIVDRILLNGKYPVDYKSNVVSNENLLDLFITFLRDNDALLIKSDVVCQIVPVSRKPGGHWQAITHLKDIPAIVNRSGRPRLAPSVKMSFDGASIADFCKSIAIELKIAPLLIDPDVKGYVTLITSVIPAETQFPILMAVLENSDAVLIESMGEYQIIPKSKALPGQWKILTELPPSAPSTSR
jgi:hypothetical protein